MSCGGQPMQDCPKYFVQEKAQWESCRDEITSDERIFPENCNVRALITDNNKNMPRHLISMQQTAPLVTIYRGDQQLMAYSRIHDKQRIIFKSQIELESNQIQTKEKFLLKFQYADKREAGDDGLLYQIQEVIDKQNQSMLNNTIHTMGSLIAAVSKFNHINYNTSSAMNRPKRIAFVNLSGQESLKSMINWKQSYETLGDDYPKPLYISFFKDNIDSLLYFDNQPRINKQILTQRQAYLLKVENGAEISLNVKQTTQFNKRVIRLDKDQLEMLSLAHAVREQNDLLKLNNDSITLIPVAMFSDELEDYQLDFILQTLKLALSDYNPHQIFLQLGINANKSGLQKIIYELTQMSNNRLIIHTKLQDDNSSNKAAQQNYESLNLIIEGTSNNINMQKSLITPNAIQERTTWFDYTYQRLLEYKDKDCKIIRFWVKDARNSCHNLQAIQQQKLETKMPALTDTHPLQKGLEFLTNKIAIEDDNYDLVLLLEDGTTSRVFLQPNSQVLIDPVHQLAYIHDGLNKFKQIHCYGSYSKSDTNITLRKIDQSINIKFPTILLKDRKIYWIYGYANNQFVDQILVFHQDGRCEKLTRKEDAQFEDVRLRRIQKQDIAGRCRPGVCAQGFSGGDFALFGGEDILGDRIFNIMETIKIEGLEFHSAIINKQYCRKTGSLRVDVLPLVLFIEDSYYIFPGNKHLFQNPYSFKSDNYEQGKQITIRQDSILIQNFDIVYKGDKYIQMHKVMNGWRYLIQSEQGYQFNLQKTLLYSDTRKFEINNNELNFQKEKYEKSSLMNLKFQFNISNPIQSHNDNQVQKRFEITSKVFQVTQGLSLVMEQKNKQQEQPAPEYSVSKQQYE